MTVNGPAPPLQLLVIDDDDVDRERVLRFLARSALHAVATEASSGKQAMQLVRTLRFDCIVLDNQLGDTTGSALLRDMHTADVHLCPVIMVTGAGNEALVVQTLQEGAADYLSKLQLNPDNLAQAILRSIETHQLRREIDDMHRELERRVEDQAAVIRQRERDLQDILDHSASLIAYCDAKQRMRFGNPPHQAWFGVAPEQLPGLHMREVLGHGLYASHLPHIEGVLAGIAQSFEQALHGPLPGQTRHVQVEYRPDVDTASPRMVRGFYITITDVTPVKLAQLNVQEFLRFMKAVVDKAPVGMAVYREDGRCVLANTAMAEIIGVGMEDLHRQTLWSLTRHHSVNLAVVAQATLADGQTRHANQIAHPPTGRAVHVAWSLARVERGPTPHLVAIARDITDQQALNESLVTARDTAEDAVRIKSAFLANMSHEIRTPMNAIVGLSRLVLESPLPSSAREQIDRVHESSVALMGILDDILDYSKAEAGQMRLEHLPVQLEDTLQRVADLFAGRMAQKRIAFSIDLAPQVPAHLMGDPLRLSQILNNLVGNAVKFTDNGGVHLAVSVEGHHGLPVQTPGQLALRFAIQDTGIGIAPEAQQALFAPFAQGDASITRRFGGSGLGLTICKRLVDMMGGQIGVHSTPGQGSEFWFKLPLHPVDEIANADAEPLQACRVLLFVSKALDAPWLPALLRVLRSAQVSAEIVDQVDAVGALLAQGGRETQPFDALMLDWETPVDDAQALYEAVCKQAQGTGAPPPLVHLVPAHARPAVMALQQASGTDVLLFKPLLPGAIRHALRRARTPTAQQSQTSPGNALQERGRPLSGLRVLLVEDNPINQVVAQAFLEQAGLEVVVLSDGRQAVNKMQEVAPGFFCAILMDMHMPVMDGLEATRRIREIVGARHVPVIAMTAAVLPADKALCFEAGMVDFITKPIMPEALIDTLVKWTEAGRRAGA